MLQNFIWQLILILGGIHRISYANEFDGDDENEDTFASYRKAFNVDDDSEKPSKSKKDERPRKNLNCDNFSDYALNCTMQAALMYNSNKKSPPLPHRMDDWCKAVKYLTNCALEWNIDCREVTDSHFNEESINGHSYVVHNICDDKHFLDNYNELAGCIDGTADSWENCYTTFKNVVDGFKMNTSSEWTHFETHFYLCCGRSKFRRCVLDTVLSRSDICTKSQALVLQKFSVIVSEGDVYQDCNFNMMYSNCPGGDPRPPSEVLGLTQITDLHGDNDFMSAAERRYPFYFNNPWTLLLIWNIFLEV